MKVEVTPEMLVESDKHAAELLALFGDEAGEANRGDVTATKSKSKSKTKTKKVSKKKKKKKAKR